MITRHFDRWLGADKNNFRKALAQSMNTARGGRIAGDNDDKLKELCSALGLNPFSKATYISPAFDCVVLGCTHYVLIRDLVQKLFPTAKLLDGNHGVARRVKMYS